jgi:lipoyl(octanoyl) transferase
LRALIAGPEKTCQAVFFHEPVAYEKALALQMKICELKKRGLPEDFLLLLEHPPVITLGRNGNWQNLVVSEEMLRIRGVSRFQADRGGDITFHGPGQLVGYPLLALEARERDVHRYMRNLEETIIRTAGHYGIEARRESGLTGVWTDSGKICALGVHISRWITHHGFALNVNTDLSFYDLIVPCGLIGKPVSSMRAALGRNLDFGEVSRKLADQFGQVFGRKMIPISGADLAALRIIEG